MKCNNCANYLEKLDVCKFCSFEENTTSISSDDWDILHLDEDKGWEHIQIRDRLISKGIDCYCVDIWFDKNMAYLMGVREDSSKVAEVLGVHEEIIYHQMEYDFMILNLFQEKYLRKEFCEECDD